MLSAVIWTRPNS